MSDDILTRIDATLRHAQDLHWSDPAFLEWERDQVGGVSHQYDHLGAVCTHYRPGPSAVDRGVEAARPMIDLIPAGVHGGRMHIAADLNSGAPAVTG